MERHTAADKKITLTYIGHFLKIRMKGILKIEPGTLLYLGELSLPNVKRPRLNKISNSHAYSNPNIHYCIPVLS